MNARRLVRLIVWLIGFIVGFAWMFINVNALAVGMEGVTVGDAIFWGGIFGFLFGFVFYFIEGKIEARVRPISGKTG
jgi:small-conductance mechanosensitive channel